MAGNGEHLLKITPEERAAMVERSKQAKKDQKEYAEANLKLDFMDEPEWRRMASKVGFRLATRYAPSTNPKYIRKLLRHLGKDSSWLEEHTGCKNSMILATMNPTWPAFAVQGCILESYLSELENGN